MGLGHNFSDMTPKSISNKNNKWDYIKRKGLCTANETVNKMKRQTTKWVKTLANLVSDRELIFKIHNELVNSIAKNNPIKNGQGTQLDIFSKKAYRWPAST